LQETNTQVALLQVPTPFAYSVVQSMQPWPQHVLSLETHTSPARTYPGAHAVSVQLPDAPHAPVPLLYRVVQSAQDAPQHWFVSAAQDNPLVWKPLAQVKTHTLPPQDAVPFSTLAQSVVVEQPVPGAHPAAHPPPQSTSVSSPSFT
jgi:hypothetical protein